MSDSQNPKRLKKSAEKDFAEVDMGGASSPQNEVGNPDTATTQNQQPYTDGLPNIPYAPDMAETRRRLAIANQNQEQGPNNSQNNSPPTSPLNSKNALPEPAEFLILQIQKIKDFTPAVLLTFKGKFEENQKLVKFYMQTYELIDPALYSINEQTKSKDAALPPFEESERLLKLLPTEATAAKLVKVYNELVAAVLDDMALVFTHLQKIEQLLNLVETDNTKLDAMTTPQLKVNLRMLLPTSPIVILVNKINTIVNNLNVFINTAKTTQFLVYMSNGVKLQLKPPRKDHGQIDGLTKRREKLTKEIKEGLLTAIKQQLGATSME